MKKSTKANWKTRSYMLNEKKKGGLKTEVVKSQQEAWAKIIEKKHLSSFLISDQK